MKYLGLDLGSKTLGLALSDLTKTIASSYTTIFFKNEEYNSLIPILKDIVKKENIDKLILGYPINMNNTIGDRAKKILNFKEILEQNKFKVILQDERLSSKEANKYLIEGNMRRNKRKKTVDKLAATIILQTYLNKERNDRNGTSNI